MHVYHEHVDIRPHIKVIITLISLWIMLSIWNTEVCNPEGCENQWSKDMRKFPYPQCTLVTPNLRQLATCSRNSHYAVECYDLLWKFWINLHSNRIKIVGAFVVDLNLMSETSFDIFSKRHLSHYVKWKYTHKYIATHPWIFFWQRICVSGALAFSIYYISR